MQFGRVVDATLMIDKDTGRPRGFGFVTFDSETAVENALSRPLEILGKAIEVKKAQPRGNLRDEDRGRRGGGGRDGFRDMNQGGGNGGGGGGDQQQGGQQGMAGGMTPQMMAQYWQRMQQYFAMMQQQMAMSGQGQAMPAGMAMGGMNPAMMQQMQQMQQQQMQQQQMKGMGNNQQQGSMSPNPQSPGSQPSMPNMMNPASMIQPIQNPGQGTGGNGSVSPGPNAAAYGHQTGPGYNAHEQIAFEQQKYEQQQARRQMDNRAFSPYQQGGPTSWEGMYDEVPQPNIPSGPQGMNHTGSMGRRASLPMRQPITIPTNLPLDALSSSQPSTAPANAPTGPRNAGKPGANYRGGGRGGHRGFHPYSR
jgi:RNA-binding protein Musashi